MTNPDFAAADELSSLTLHLQGGLTRVNMTGIIPKSEAKGVDICGTEKKHYIIRSDLGCYMESTDFHTGKDLQVYSLHPCCQGGDHYLADKNKFYIIKGKSYRCVTDLSKDSDAVVSGLHPDCQGGDYYLWADGFFCIINLSKGTYLKTSDLTQKIVQTYNITPDTEVKDALYYWGTDTYSCFIKPKDQWGIQFQMIKFYKGNSESLSKFSDKKLLSFHPDVLNFLPGGVAETHGPVFGKWELIKTIHNDSETDVKCDKKITRKVGYTKSRTSSIEQNWKVNITGKLLPDLVKLILMSEFSFSAEYSGKYVKTDSEIWTDATDEEEAVSVTLPPKKKMYVWQYQLGFGMERVLHCRDLRFTSVPNPPSDDPLPKANK